MANELDPAPFRLITRRLVGLTNSELAMLFQKRANAVAEDLDGHVWWESPFLVYWNQFIELQDKLYEVMMEIQSRYPATEVKEFYRTLPVVEPKECSRMTSIISRPI